MMKDDLENKDGICSCANRYSIEPHGNGHALMFAACPHRHGYNMGLITDEDMPMLNRMIERLAALAEKEGENGRLREALEKIADEDEACDQTGKSNSCDRMKRIARETLKKEGKG